MIASINHRRLVVAVALAVGAGMLAPAAAEAATPADIQLSDLQLSNPRNTSTDQLPHGYTSKAEFSVTNPGDKAVPAGRTLKVTLTGGAQPGAVTWNTTGADVQLPCTRTASGSKTVLSCTTPRVAAGAAFFADIAIAVPEGLPVGRAGKVSVEYVPGTTDPTPTDNELTATYRVGRVVQLLAAVTTKTPTIKVGKTGTVDVKVTNYGPDTSSSEAFVDIVWRRLQSKYAKVTVRNLDGETDVFPEQTTFEGDLPALAAGKSFTVHVDVTARAARSDASVLAVADDLDNFNRCDRGYDPEPECTSTTGLTLAG